MTRGLADAAVRTWPGGLSLTMPPLDPSDWWEKHVATAWPDVEQVLREAFGD